MTDLTSIDLTQGMRFGRAMNDGLNTSLVNDTSALHRLSRGEIPHDTGSNISIVNNRIGDWVVTTTSSNTLTVNIESVDDLPTWSTSWADWADMNNTWHVDRSWTTRTSTTDSSFSDINENLTNTNIWITSNDYNSFSIYTNDGHESVSDLSISERLKYDPFTSIGDSSSFEAIERLSRADYEHNHSGIPKRLLQDGMNDDYYYSDILDVLEYAERLDDRNDDDDDSTFIGFRSYDLSDEARLKKRAPFIKRVYRTRGGHSFDDTELHFDMILAQEHFDEVTNNIGRI